MATLINVPNETTGRTSRVTREGRKITYQLNVIQQPERARACGQGAKASTDRRPVDPPPIVELRIFEGEDASMDVTFSYRANFFLYTTLENARTIAHGRMPQSSVHTPVLTGMPVAGMCYLDRPSPAGYFTFPDLSVRHEGKYRMKFTLFEELKDTKDGDPEPKESSGNNGETESCVGNVYTRCEVQSAPFNVYSAKKFPGLNESTPLSRMVADQGCRVRIRRDVRMRRRDPKESKDWDNYEDDTADQRARQSETPDVYQQAKAGTPAPTVQPDQRPRSMSNASNASYHGQQPHSLHRTQSQDLTYQQGIVQQQHSAPPTPQHAYPPAYHGYEQHPAFVSQYMQHHQPPMSPHAQQIPQQFHHHPQQSPYASLQQQQMMHVSPGYPYPPHVAQQHSMYEQHQINAAHYQQQQHASADYARMYGSQQPPMHQQHSSNSSAGQAVAGQSLPSLKGIDPSSHSGQPPQLQPKNEPASPATYASPNMYGPEETHARPPPAQYISASASAGATAPKRSYGTVFNASHTEGSLRGGARPNVDYSDAVGLGVMTNGVNMGMSSSAADDANASDDDMEMLIGNMSYRRADGRSVRVPWPQSS